MIRLRPCLFLIASAALSACTAMPEYPIEPGQPMGSGGVVVDNPRYPVEPGAQGVRPQTASAPSTTLSSPRPRPAPSDDADAPRAAPSRTIAETPLQAPGSRWSAGASSTNAPPPPPPPPPDSLLGGAHPSLPRAPSAAASPAEVQVQPFETVYDVAERMRTPLRAIIQLNHLSPPYTLSPGRILLVPAPVVYVVQDGDTLFGVARRFSVDPRSLANLNDIPLETRVKAGQRLILPALVRDGGVNTLARGERPMGLESGPPALALGAETTRGVPTFDRGLKAARGGEGFDEHGAGEQPPRPAAAPASDAEVVSLGKGRFLWPLHGEVLSDFGPKGPGQRNDGVNIAAQSGAPVRVAAAGTVVYAGDSIPAFGNLVLVKHPGGWATLYGNLGRISVKNNAQVVQGEEIGTAGVSGEVDRPQVHFEIRYARDPKDKARPYDPVELLPPKGELERY